ncbi:MAG: hypothetical protein ACHQ0Y_02880 [Thermodesulfovibrionales bacterium]
MVKTAEIIISSLCAIGAIEVSYVESRIISKAGAIKSGENSLLEIYWSNLSVKERWIFWTGFILLISPFVLAIAI